MQDLLPPWGTHCMSSFNCLCSSPCCPCWCAWCARCQCSTWQCGEETLGGRDFFFQLPRLHSHGSSEWGYFLTKPFLLPLTTPRSEKQWKKCISQLDPKNLYHLIIISWMFGVIGTFLWHMRDIRWYNRDHQINPFFWGRIKLDSWKSFFFFRGICPKRNLCNQFGAPVLTWVGDLKPFRHLSGTP